MCQEACHNQTWAGLWTECASPLETDLLGTWPLWNKDWISIVKCCAPGTFCFLCYGPSFWWTFYLFWIFLPSKFAGRSYPRGMSAFTHITWHHQHSCGFARFAYLSQYCSKSHRNSCNTNVSLVRLLLHGHMTFSCACVCPLTFRYMIPVIWISIIPNRGFPLWPN